MSDPRLRQLSPGAVLLDPNGIVVLKASRVRRFWFFVGSVLLAGAGIIVLASGQDSFWGWAGLLLFGFAAFLFVVQLVRPDSLRLCRDAFTYANLGRHTRMDWADVAEFGVLQLPVRGGTIKQVGIRLKTPRSGLVRELVSGTNARYDAILPETYRLPVEDLCALMEEWRIAAERR